MDTEPRTVTPDRLNEFMDFDCVIEVLPDGQVKYRPDLDGPSLRNGEIEGSHDGWDLMGGYSGQDRYSGPIMHNSEFIGGGMARDILEKPGLYVSLVCYWDREDEDSDNVEGWAVAYREAE